MRGYYKLGEMASYDDMIQLDGAFSVCHINYGKSPMFGKVSGKKIASNINRRSSLLSGTVSDIHMSIKEFNGTEKGYEDCDRIILWKSYWIEYINAFEKLINSLPKSIVTVHIGRQAVEIGFKYLILKKDKRIDTHHRLDRLSKAFFCTYNSNEVYLEYIEAFCDMYTKYIEGKHVEYFRYPEYKDGDFFAGYSLDIEWLTYNLLLILLKLIHFAELDCEI